MNDNQENTYNVEVEGIEAQQAKVAESKERITALQNEYLQSVLSVAITMESNRRKEDRLIFIVPLGIVALIALIALFINYLVGVILAIVGYGIAFVVITMTQLSRTMNYSNRKAFFDKYSYALKAEEKFKWKNTTPVAAKMRKYTSGEWDCPRCKNKNAKQANFCVNCGNPKPLKGNSR